MENPAIAWCIWTLNKISKSVAVTWNLISQNWMSFRFLNDFDLESSEWFCKNFHWIFSHIFSLFLFLVHHPLGPRRQKHPGQAINNNLITMAVRVEPCRSSRTRTTFCGILKALTSARNRERFMWITVTHKTCCSGLTKHREKSVGFFIYKKISTLFLTSVF